MDRIYSDGLKKYEDRIVQYGFKGFEHVLDAGCGFGQWSLVLSDLNKKVSSIEFQKNRVNSAKEIAKELNKENIDFTQGSIENLPYGDGSFDAVFCYGVLFLTDWKKSLSEFCRVLKPNGKIYVNANGNGWYYNLIINEHNKTIDYNPREYAIDAFLNTERYNNNKKLYKSGHDVIIEKTEIRSEMKHLGFTDIQIDGEGKINAKNAHPFFKEEYFGEVGCYELIAKKGDDVLC